MTSRPSSRNAVAAEAMTAFAPGAGPPEKMIPTRRTPSPFFCAVVFTLISISGLVGGDIGSGRFACQPDRKGARSAHDG